MHTNISQILLVATGGIFGALLRYLVSIFSSQSISTLPYATYMVNAVGCFIIGLLLPFFEQGTLSENQRLLIQTGFLGALTTFSTFSLEILQMITSQQYVFATLYAFLSVTTCVGFTLIGHTVSIWLNS